MSRSALEALEVKLANEYERALATPASLDLTRGKPAADQLDLSTPLDGILQGAVAARDGTDIRNYGGLRGIPEARELGARLLDVDADLVIAGGNSSLWFMHLVMDTAMHHGLLNQPWREMAETVKALCPIPGFDRHFTLTEAHGIEMINVAMTPTGPDMDVIESKVEADPDIKCIWCVPKYQNPTGCIFSADTVQRLAELPTRAGDAFTVFWDNAYSVHDLEFPPPPLESLMKHAQRAGTQARMVMFASTSKITYAGSGVAFLASGAAMLDAIEARMSIMTIGPDKMNQLRHTRWLDGRLEAHMKAHAELIRPKFEAVQNGLERDLGGFDVASWTNPKGGYFITVDTHAGLAAKTITLADAAGVKLTRAGAPFPYAKDPEDRTIRLAPTYASLEETVMAVDLLCLCIKLATARKFLAKAA
ncbi:MAG: aminotransferase class I/II-fold pyridoxal phosphate-dependent enzyme [Gammaproteobacteria bacterium]|nr:aminotransferase class I/II-fold pyridoxal phosphate-dependent enzyme [Gammaproteobacteria bacterium]